MSPPDATGPAALAIEGVSRRYGALVAVDGVSLTLQAGEILALLGANGAGKTSLLAILAGLVEADQGRVTVCGVEGLTERRKRVGYCPQTPLIWGDLTALEQLAFVGEIYGRSVRSAQARGAELLETLGLTAKAGALAATLSGGMQRRLNFALALVHEPPILILDEPTVSLDLESRRLVHHLLTQLRDERGTSILLSTHDIPEAEQLADRVAIMDRGRILAVGTAAEIKARGAGAATIEILLPGAAVELQHRATSAINGLAQRITWIDDRLFLEVPGVASHLGRVCAALEEESITPREIKSRERTLEDAVLAITGRRVAP